MHSRPSVGIGVASILSSYYEFRNMTSLNTVPGERGNTHILGKELKPLLCRNSNSRELTLWTFIEFIFMLMSRTVNWVPSNSFVLGYCPKKATEHTLRRTQLDGTHWAWGTSCNTGWKAISLASTRI